MQRSELYNESYIDRLKEIAGPVIDFLLEISFMVVVLALSMGAAVMCSENVSFDIFFTAFGR